jgi:ArsR family transcriptional regulator
MPKQATRAAHAELSPEAIELIAARFRVLGEPSRLKLIHALNGGERSVNQLTEAAGLTQANASRHLQTLMEAGILKRRKQGIQVLYSVADTNIFNLCEHVCGSLQQRLENHAKAFLT